MVIGTIVVMLTQDRFELFVVVAMSYAAGEIH
jgi:hypothetical protein